MSLVNDARSKKMDVKSHYLRSCDFEANLSMVKTLGLKLLMLKNHWLQMQ